MFFCLKLVDRVSDIKLVAECVISSITTEKFIFDIVDNGRFKSLMNWSREHISTVFHCYWVYLEDCRQ